MIPYRRWSLADARTLVLMTLAALPACSSNDVAAPAAAAQHAPAGAARANPDTTKVRSTVPIAGAMDGSTCRARPSGGTWQPGEDLCLTLPSRVTGFSYTIAPSAPSETVTAMNGDERTLQIQFRRRSGTAYAIAFRSLGTTGGRFDGYALTVETPPAAAQLAARSRPIAHETSYFGTVVQDATAPFGLLDSLDAPYPIDAKKLAVLKAQGIQIARTEVSPFFTNPARGVYDFSKFDPVIDALARAGIDSYVGIPASTVQGWASNASSQRAPLYAKPADYAAYCGAVAGHLGRRYPRISRVSIVGNEPNVAGNWDDAAGAALGGIAAYDDPTGPGEAAYLKPCYAAIKRANPRLRVFAPEMAFGGTTDALPFLRNLYAAGCRVGTCFDGLSMHLSPYNDMRYPTNACFFAGAGWTGRCYKDAQRIAIAHGDPVPPVILSETGYTTAEIPQGYDEPGQAVMMSREFAALEADPTVRGVYWSYIDGNGTAAGTFFGEFRTVRADGTHKPAFDTLRAFATF